MGIIRETLKETALVSANNTIAFFLGFLTTIITINLLGAKQFGILALSMSILSIITLILDMGLSKLVVSEAARPKNENKGLLLGYGIIQTIISITIGTIIIIFSKSISELLSYEIQQILILIGALVVLSGIKNTIITTLQTETKFSTYGKLLLLESLFRLILITIFLNFLTKKTEYVLLAYLITEFIIAILFLKSITIKKTTFKEELKEVKNLLTIIKQHGKWSFVISLLRSIESNLPIWIIQTFLGTTAVGIYSALLKIQTTAIRLFEPLETILYPTISKISQTKDYEKMIYRTTKYILYLSLPITLVFIIFSEQIIDFTIGKEFTPYSNIFRIIILAIPLFIINIPQKPFLFTMKAQKQLAIIALILLIFTITFGTTMTIYFGLIGIAISEIVKLILELTEKNILISKISQKRIKLEDIITPDYNDKEILRKILKAKK
ncbi:MAG: oligosaccharide flippase family protein [Candidatus Diapherotrites archaeon]